MKALLLSPEVEPPGEERSSHLRAVAAYMLPDSFWNLAGVMLLTFLACWGGITLGQTPAEADILWPANGMLLGFLIQLSRRHWFSYLAAGVIANVAAHAFFPFSLKMSLIFSTANTVEVLLAAHLLSIQEDERLDLTQVRDLIRFAVLGVCTAPLVSTVAVALLDFDFSRARNLRELANWCFGEMMGIAIVTPLVLAIRKCEITSLFAKGRRSETIALLIALVILSYGVFAQSRTPIVFLILPALVLTTFRLGSAGSAIGVSLIVAPAAYFTSRQTGPFAPTHPAQLNYSIFYLQGFLGVSLVTIYAVSASLAARQRTYLELTEAYREAGSIAARDHLTGLANRRSFDEQLAREWRRAAREKMSLSIILIDVDHFKLFNDWYGHLAGDDCLREVGAILAEAPLRGTDLAARFGGEEFAILLPRAGVGGALLIAERIRQAIADKQFPHASVPAGIVTTSVGVATIYPEPEGDPFLVVQHADEALYRAKKAGRNQVQVWRSQA